MRKLSEEEVQRYQRNLWVEGFSPQMQGALGESAVLVVGAGGLGSVVLQYLAAAGVGRIGIVDFDVVSVSNLQRQILYVNADIGLPKVSCAARRLRAINPRVHVVEHNAKLLKDNVMEVTSDYQMVVDCTDNYAVRYLLDDCCRATQKPLIYGTAEQVGGQVSVFHWRGAAGYAQLYPTAVTIANPRIGVLSPLPGIIGSIQAMEVIKIITGWGDPLAGRLLVFDAQVMQVSVFEI